MSRSKISTFKGKVVFPSLVPPQSIEKSIALKKEELECLQQAFAESKKKQIDQIFITTNLHDKIVNVQAELISLMKTRLKLDKLHK